MAQSNFFISLQKRFVQAMYCRYRAEVGGKAPLDKKLRLLFRCSIFLQSVILIENFVIVRSRNEFYVIQHSYARCSQHRMG